MKIERTRNAIRNTKWGVVQKTVNILFPFIVRTVLIYTLSAEYAGLSSLFTSILSILSLTELGFSNAIVYHMYKPIANDDKEKVCTLLNVYKKAYLVIGIVILIIGISIIPILPYLIKDDIPDSINLYVLYGVYLANNVISYFLYGYKTSLLSAYQREDIISKNTLIYTVLLNGFQCIILIFFRNYYAFVVIIPLATIVLNLLNNRSAKKMFPEFKPEGKLDAGEKSELRRSIVGLMIWKLGGATRNTFDSIVVSMYLGLVTVSIYNNYFYIIYGLNAILGVIITSITAGVGNKIATDTPENNYKDFRKFQFYYNWIAGLCAIYLMCLYQPFMNLWMGSKMMFSNGIMFLFCYYFLMLQQGNINSVYYHAAGLWWHGRIRSIIEAIVNLCLNFVLGKYWGVVGILLATIISFSCINFYGSKFIFTEYFKNKKTLKYFVENYYCALITCICGIISYVITEYFAKIVGFNLIIRLVIGVCVCTLIPNIMFFLVYSCNKTYKVYIREAIKNISKLRRVANG